jgi:uncharacterized protein YcbX
MRTDSPSPAAADDLWQAARVAALHVYPVKSCAGESPAQALLVETGLELDRAFMVVDEHGEFLSQRELPRLALVRTRLGLEELRLKAPGMLGLHVRLDTVESACRVRVWDDEVKAWDLGDLPAQWFSDFLGRRARLVRFDPDQRRLSSVRWTGAIEAPNAFSDGYPLLVTSTGSLEELNARLARAGQGAVDQRRFRPNLVLEGLDAHGEDLADELLVDGPDGPVHLRLVKPCARCPMPDVDPDTGDAGHAVGDALAGYRADPRMNGALTWGMNAVIVAGQGRRVRVGDPVRVRIRF